MGIVQGIVVYQDVDYKGESVKLGVGTHQGASKYYTDKKEPAKKNTFKSNDISSLKIDSGLGVVLTAKDGRTLRFINTIPDTKDSKGNTVKHTLNIPSLVKYNFNDVVTTIQVFKVDKGFRITDKGELVEPFAVCGVKLTPCIIAVIVLLILATLFIATKCFKKKYGIEGSYRNRIYGGNW